MRLGLAHTALPEGHLVLLMQIKCPHTLGPAFPPRRHPRHNQEVRVEYMNTHKNKRARICVQYGAGIRETLTASHTSLRTTKRVERPGCCGKREGLVNTLGPQDTETESGLRNASAHFSARCEAYSGSFEVTRTGEMRRGQTLARTVADRVGEERVRHGHRLTLELTQGDTEEREASQEGNLKKQQRADSPPPRPQPPFRPGERLKARGGSLCCSQPKDILSPPMFPHTLGCVKQ